MSHGALMPVTCLAGRWIIFGFGVGVNHLFRAKKVFCNARRCLAKSFPRRLEDGRKLCENNSNSQGVGEFGVYNFTLVEAANAMSFASPSN